MHGNLLATKLHIPAIRPDTLNRARLIDILDNAVNTNLTLIAAPAGFGKSTLVAGWLSERLLFAGWLSLDERDNDPVRFWQYMVAALQGIDSAICTEASDILANGGHHSLEPVIGTLINDLSARSDDYVLVLDDYHVIDNIDIHTSIQFLLDNQPPSLHLMMLTRVDPPLRLSRLRARREMIEIRADALGFTPEETASLLNNLMAFDLNEEQVQALQQRTEGWITGLQLAALSLQTQPDTMRFIEQFTGSYQYILDYLTEEVLGSLPHELRLFLMQTAILDRLCVDLCQTITGQDDSHSLLDAIYKQNLFLIPLDDTGDWFRYHHLFADLLRVRLRRNLSVNDITELHLRASDWYEKNALTAEAIDHALAAQDYDRVASLVDRGAHRELFAGNVNLVRSWLDAIPDAIFKLNPHLTFYQFWVEILQGTADLSDQAMQEKESTIRELPPSLKNDQMRGELMAVVCRAMVFSGQTDRGIRYAHVALDYLPQEDLASRARANSSLAVAHGLEGRVKEAEDSYIKFLKQARAAGDKRLAAHTMMAMALIHTHYGQLHEATQTFQAIIDMNPSPVDRMGVQREVFPAGQGYIGLGIIHLEWNDLPAAERYLKQGIDLCRRGGLDGLFLGKIFLSRLRQAQGDFDAALEALQLAEQAFQRADDFNIASRHIEIALAQGEIENAARFAALLEPMVSDGASVRLPILFAEIVQILISRVLIAQGEIEQALMWLDRVQSTAEPARRNRRLIDVYLLRARIEQQISGAVTHAAVGYLEQALELAEPEGFVLLFREEGAALIPLLNVVSRHKPYARKLLSAFAGDDKATAGEAPGLLEALTPREMEVLRLIAVGDSNQIIAEKLFISIRTVKKHITNILGKLDADNRTQAVAVARELGLLSTG